MKYWINPTELNEKIILVKLKFKGRKIKVDNIKTSNIITNSLLLSSPEKKNEINFF